MNARTVLLLFGSALASALPLAAQAPSPAPPPGLLSVVRGSDGTEVFIDSASVTRSGDSTFVLSTVTRFSAAVGAERRADREVESAELDCGRDRTRGIAWGLYQGGRPVSGDTLPYAWKPVDEGWLPVSRLICGRLMGSFASLPVELEADAADSPYALLPPTAEDSAAYRRHGFPGRGRWSGIAVVRVRVGADGVPDTAGARMLWASRREFAEGLRFQLSRARFTPARKDGAAVPVWSNIAMEYSVTCGNDPQGADEQRATVRRTRERVVCAY
ncbi:MAG: hypothetical protein ACJ8GN_23760 [Longimicrobiaceae bacterium]